MTSMEPLKLKPWGSEKRSQKDAAPFVQIVQTLDSQIRDNKLNIIRLFGYSHPTMPEYPPITCRLEGNDIVFEAQNYVGMFATGEAEIKVSPRFGEHILMMLMAAAANIYLPSLGSSMDKDPFHNETLLRLLWKAQLRQAIARAALPQSFIAESGNLKNFRGRLEIRPHIRHNLLDASRFYCVYSKLSADNIINRVILNVLRRLKKQHNAGPELIELEDRLESLGVRDMEIRPSDMEKIRYTAMTEAFRSLMETSRILLSNGGARSGCKTRNENTSFFIDMSELWETFLLRTLKRHLGPEGYTVISPNTGAPIYLLENHAHRGARKIRPDIIILRRERPLLIIDAKYKNYQNLALTRIIIAFPVRTFISWQPTCIIMGRKKRLGVRLLAVSSPRQ